MKIFDLGDGYSVVCTSESSSTGFRHRAVLCRNGYSITKTTIPYYNRTWECYEFESILKKLVGGYFDGLIEKEKYMEVIKTLR